MSEYEYHHYADIFPMVHGSDFNDLVADIRENGLLEPIVLLNGQILDGRNRYQACQELGITPRTIDYAGDAPLTYVISKNLHRRHLTSGQRAAIAVRREDVMAEIETQAKQQQGQRTDLLQNFVKSEPVHTEQVVADTFGTNRQYVQDAKTLRDEAPDLLEQVATGEKSLPRAKQEHRQRTGYEPPKQPPRSTTRSPSSEEVQQYGWQAYYRGVDDPQQETVALEVADVLKGLRTFEEQLHAFKQTFNTGKMSPEAKRFTARKVEKICADLTAWANELKE